MLALDLNTWLDGGRAIVEVGGEVDVYSAPMLREELARIGSPRPLRIAVVMEGVTFLDSAGVGVLIGCLKRAQATGGRVALVGCTPRVGNVLRRMGLDKLFGLHASIEDAFAWLDQTRA